MGVLARLWLFTPAAFALMNELISLTHFSRFQSIIPHPILRH